MPSTLPQFSRGLKLIRFGVFVMLAQLVLGVVTTIKAMTADTPDDARSALEWMQYLFIANLGATLAMLVGVVRAIPELARARVQIGGLAIAAAGFAIAAAAFGWTYHVLTTFVDAVLAPDPSLDAVASAASDLESLGYIAIVKDFAYALALVMVMRAVQRSAAINDQLSLRDEAGSMSRMMVVMLVADMFYQLTYGLGGSVGILGFLGALAVAIYWIYCHVRLQRFLYNAAWFVNEPHDLPIATALKVPDETSGKHRAPKPRPSAPKIAPSRPSTPSTPPPVQVNYAPPTAPQPPIAAPRAASEGEPPTDGGPRFLR